jgi:hypothetical protein
MQEAGCAASVQEPQVGELVPLTPDYQRLVRAYAHEHEHPMVLITAYYSIPTRKDTPLMGIGMLHLTASATGEAVCNWPIVATPLTPNGLITRAPGDQIFP